jgi:hypothetical protein
MIAFDLPFPYHMHGFDSRDCVVKFRFHEKSFGRGSISIFR